MKQKENQNIEPSNKGSEAHNREEGLETQGISLNKSPDALKRGEELETKDRELTTEGGAWNRSP